MKKTKKLILFVLFLPLSLLIRLIMIFTEIRFIPINERIGHGVGNIDVYLAEKRFFKEKSIDIFYPDRPGKGNQQVLKMLSRVIYVNNLAYWVVWANWNTPLDIHYDPLSSDKDMFGLLKDTPCSVSFTEEEEIIGKNLLWNLDIPEGEKYVCFHARDKSYLNETQPGIDWSYHNHRDFDIDIYIQEIKELVNRGYYCVRMGRIVEKPFGWKDSHVIDYAISQYRSDFADMYLISKCSIYLGTSSGLDRVARLFRKEIICKEK